MRTLHTSARADEDGVIRLNFSLGSADTEYEVLVVLQPKEPRTTDGPEDLAWKEFIEKTAGSWQGEFIRDQGRFGEPESL